MKYLKNRWNRIGGYREVLVVAIPLILSTATWSIQHFVDRMFLTWYSPETIAASMPAGMLSFTIISIFMGTAAYVLLPDLFVAPFAHQADPARFAEIYGYSIVLLRFVAIYCLFDTMNIIFCSAIKGAGDTRYVMKMTTILSIFVLFIPVYLAVEVLEAGLMVAWVFATAYVISLGVTFYLRFLGGEWKSMRVIEQAPQVPKIGPTKMGRAVK